ncbi:MAG TPA: hypothetical protein VE136_07700 [Anaerolineales bacterium]|jgi:hypothetical protein|nr:hypothetical protein [Anaerolineales bacterium]
MEGWKNGRLDWTAADGQLTMIEGEMRDSRWLTGDGGRETGEELFSIHK